MGINYKINLHHNTRLQNEKITLSGIGLLLIIFVTPFLRININGRGILSYVIPITFILLVAGFIMNRNNLKIRLDSIQIWIIFISALLAVSTLYLPINMQNISLENIKVQIISIFLFAYFLNKRETNALLLVSFGAAIIFVYCYFYSSDFYLGGIRKRILLPGDIYLDPNMVIASFIVPVIASIKYILEKNSLFVKLFFIVFLGLSLYGAFLGASRGGLLAIIIGVFIYLFLQFKPTVNNIIKYVFGVSVIVILLYIVMKNISPELIQRMTIGDVLENGGSGRFDIFEDHFKSFFLQDNIFRILFGNGKESCKLLLGISSHNIFIDYMWDLGITGCLLYLVVTLKTILYALKCKSNFGISVIISTIIWSFTISSSNQLIYWVLIYSGLSIAKNDTPY